MPIKGLDDLSKKLGQLADNAKDLGNTTSAPATDILTPEFIAQHTKFSDLAELLQAGGFDVASFQAIPQEKLDGFISSVSSFGSWQEMINSAGVAWAKRKLGF